MIRTSSLSVDAGETPKDVENESADHEQQRETETFAGVLVEISRPFNQHEYVGDETIMHPFAIVVGAGKPGPECDGCEPRQSLSSDGTQEEDREDSACVHGDQCRGVRRW